MSDRPEELDKEIDRLLRELGSAEPAAGLEQRVLQRVNASGAAARGAEPRGWRRMLPAGRPWQLAAAPWQIAVVSAPLLLLALVLWFGHGRQTAPGAVSHATKETPAKAAFPAPVPARATDAGAGGVAKRSARAFPAARPVRRSPAPQRPESEDRLLALGNHPAPEAPLTDEERLLLRLAHHAGPDEFAVLNPDARDARAMADKAEFRRFFGPPVTGGSE